jgi:hypothetical protein
MNEEDYTGPTISPIFYLKPDGRTGRMKNQNNNTKKTRERKKNVNWLVQTSQKQKEAAENKNSKMNERMSHRYVLPITANRF